MRLILFDIDGTLLRCGPQTRPFLARALESVYGSHEGLAAVLDAYDFSGKLDPQIIFDLMGELGLDRAAIRRHLPLLQARYLDNLEQGLRRDGMELLPGVDRLLRRLHDQPDVVLGLLTGNWEAGARIKLSRFDLNRFLPFGAFGGDGERRSDLVPVALGRAHRSAVRSFHPREALIVGDSVHDVACGRAHGVPVVAVRTGFTDRASLEAAGADWVFDDLPSAGRELPLLAC